MNDCPQQDMKRVWQGQESSSDSISLDQVCVKASRFQGKIWWRNLREYVAAVLVVTVFAFYIWAYQTPLLRIGSALCIIGCLYAMIQLHKRGSARTLARDLGATKGLQFHRGELEKQRNALQGIWSWYLLPLVPGLVVFSLGRGVELGVPWTRLGLYIAICGVLFWVFAEVNRWAARKLQKQIDALPVLEQDG